MCRIASRDWAVLIQIYLLLHTYGALSLDSAIEHAEFYVISIDETHRRPGGGLRAEAPQGYIEARL